MGDSQPYVTMCMNSVGKILYINADNKSSSAAPLGYQVRIPMNPVAWNAMAYQERKDTVEVVTLPTSYTIPTPLIATWPSGPVELYASSIGFRYETTTPAVLTSALVLDLRPGSLKSFNLLVGGPVSTPTISFQKLLGLDGRTAGGPEAKFSVKIDPAEILFIPNRAVTEFMPISERFRGSLSSPGVAMNWSEGAGVYVRLVENIKTKTILHITLPDSELQLSSALQQLPSPQLWFWKQLSLKMATHGTASLSRGRQQWRSRLLLLSHSGSHQLPGTVLCQLSPCSALLA